MNRLESPRKPNRSRRAGLSELSPGLSALRPQADCRRGSRAPAATKAVRRLFEGDLERFEGSPALASARFLPSLGPPLGVWVDAHTLMSVVSPAEGSIHWFCSGWSSDVSRGCRAEMGFFCRSSAIGHLLIAASFVRLLLSRMA